MFYTVRDWKRVRHVAVLYDSGHQAVVWGPHHADKFERAAEFRQNGQEARSADGVECLSQVYEQEVQVLALLQAFLP